MNLEKKVIKRLFLIISLFFVYTMTAVGHTEVFDKSHVIDVLIPCHPKDAQVLALAIHGIKKHGKNIRRIIVVSDTQLTQDAEYFDQKRYPFTIQDIALAIFHDDKKQAQAYAQDPNNKLGWIYQQLLKLYAFFVIPDVSDNILMLDADTIFLHDVSFIDDNGYALYNTGREYHKPYFKHAQRLLPDFKRVFSRYSGICHHMLMQRIVIEDLFKEIKKYHTQEPWQAICSCIDLQDLQRPCLSEYEIYFNFIFSRAYNVKLRRLKWKNLFGGLTYLSRWKDKKYDYLSCHAYNGF